MSPRKTPVLLRRGGLTNGVYALLRYTRRPDGVIAASEKQDVTSDFRLLVDLYLGDGVHFVHQDDCHTAERPCRCSTEYCEGWDSAIETVEKALGIAPKVAS